MALNKPVFLFLGAAALVVAPALTPDLPVSYATPDKAFAKNGNGGGNGNAGGNGNGNGGGKGNNGNSGGNANSGNSNKGGNSSAKSSTNRGLGIFKSNSGNKQAKTGKSNGHGLNGFLNSVFGGEGRKNKSRSNRQNAQRGSSNSNTHRLPKSERVTLAAVSVTPAPSPGPKQKNFNAKLGRLNSLKRNYHAYINSNDPHLAAVVTYIDATLAYERFSDSLAVAEESLVAAKALVDKTFAEIVPHDSFAYEDLTTEEIELRLSELEDLDTSEFSEEQIIALEAEKAALSEVLESEEFSSFKDAEITFRDQEDELKTHAEATSDEALTDALLAMANDNRTRQYGDEYVDEEMLDWAKQLLGVGDYEGKIDEIREATEAPDEDEEPLSVSENGGANTLSSEEPRLTQTSE